MDKKYFLELEKNQRTYLSLDKPVVIRLDGKNVTKNHKRYPLLEEKGFTWHLMDTGSKLSYGSCTLYAVLDEISIIFPNAREFFYRFDDTNAIYSAGIVLQNFCKHFWKYDPSVQFGISIFQIPTDQIESYLDYRKELARNAAVYYIAKELKLDYRGKMIQEIRRMIRKDPDAVKLYDRLAKGYQENIKTPSFPLF